LRLTKQQLNHYETFGFLVFRQLLTADELARYSADFNTGLDSWTEGGQHDRVKRHYASLMEAESPFIASLADDPRFADVAEQLIGPDAMCIAVDGNYMVGDTDWHPDTSSLDYKAVKFCIYPDPLTANDGALRVIPGSHKDPFHSLIKRETEAEFGVKPDEAPAHVFESQPGDVLVFNVGLWHGAFGGGDHRRQGVLVYYEDPQTPAATEQVEIAMRGNQKMYAGMGRRMYGEHWRSIDNPRHQRWLRRLDDLEVLETPPAE
jgi:hypothetical protein